MYLLDTNVISEMRKARNGKADPNVVANMGVMDVSELYVSVIVLLELEHGVLLKERKDPATGAILRTWLDDRIKPEFEDRTIDVDLVVAMRCAAIIAKTPKPYRDALIASCALVHGMTVVTRNVDDFKGTGVNILNPWSAPQK